MAKSTARPGGDAALGGFAGAFDLRAAGYEDPLLLAATDGVGTKLKLAIEADKHDTVGIDLVAMCVNDLVVQGAEPLLFLDYYATGQLSVEAGSAIVAGIAEGCRQAACVLLGGETAEMPGMYRDGDYDLAGFAVGAVERGELLSGENVAAGDVVLGLASTGIHSNGFSLVRRIVEDFKLDYAAPAPFAADQSLAEALLTPTRIYVKSCLAAIAEGGVNGLCHVTGGGILENLPRVMANGTRAVIDTGAWQAPAVFPWLTGLGGMADEEMARTFNCGIGMIVVTEADAAKAVSACLADQGESVFEIGRIEASGGDDAPEVQLTNLEKAAWRG